MQKKKKRAIILITIAVVLLTTGIAVAMNIQAVMYTVLDATGMNLSKNYGGVENFEKYKEDYEVVANIAYDYYLGNPIENIRANIGYSSNLEDYFYTFVYYDSDDKRIKEYYDLTDSEKNSIRNICEYSFIAQGGARFNTIRVRHNHVVFETVNGIYALVYSVDGTTPEYVNKSDETGYAKFDKLAEHWYDARLYG